MKRAIQGKTAFDLIEEGTHLLRTAPMALLAVYFAGTAPFVLGLLYFWTDMGRNPFAEQHLAEATLGMTALFLWMKFCQAIFARRVRALAAGDAPPRFQPRQLLRIAAAQTILQPLGLIPIGFCLGALFYLTSFGLLLAIVAAIVLPFFYNVTAVTDGSSQGITAVFKKAWRLWWIWPRQNVAILAIMYFFCLFVFLNFSIFCLSLPYLMKTLFAINSEFARSPLAMLNTTFFATMFALTYLCVDPILKTLYALRCFYAESVESGEDLKAELKSFSLPSRATTVALVILAIICGGTATKAADGAAAGQQSQIEAPSAPARTPAGAGENHAGVSSPDLDQAINQTIHETKYTWRMPREKVDDSKAGNGVISRFFDNVATFLRDCARSAAEWLRRLLRKSMPQRTGGYVSTDSGEGWITLSQLLLFALIATVACVLAIFIYRAWQKREQREVVASEAIVPVPDVADENVGADQLPEDGWTELARELLERGEFRLAMRAFYLASLAHLAQRNLISIARFKSNREYERELRRRAHSFPDLLSVFGANLSIFERIWYGLHEVNDDIVNQFAANIDRMKGGG